MKRVLALFACSLAVGLRAWADDPQPAPAPAPHIAADEMSYNFGSADGSSTVEHTYVLRNTGNTTLDIKQVRPSCGCTVATPPTLTNVPPGGESQFTARLNLQGRTGHQHKTIVVESNDPQQPQLVLTLEGDVASAVAVEPERVIFGQISPDAAVTNAVMITSSSATFHINSVDAGGTTFQANTETVEDGKQYRINISTKPPLPPGGLSGVVRVFTDHPGRPSIEIPVAAAVLSEIMVAPQEMIISAPVGQTVSPFVILRPGTGKPFTITDVQTPDPAVQAQIEPFAPNGYRVTLQNVTVSPDLNGKSVRITTSSESMREIIVPIRVNNP